MTTGGTSGGEAPSSEGEVKTEGQAEGLKVVAAGAGATAAMAAEVATEVATAGNPFQVVRWRCEGCGHTNMGPKRDAHDHARTCPAGTVVAGAEAGTNAVRNSGGGTAAATSTASDRRGQYPWRERWQCDSCRVRVFDTYGEAVRHEAECLRERERDQDRAQ